MTDKLRLLVRIADTDLDGKKAIMYSLCKIKGVSLSLAHALCMLAKITPSQKTGLLSEEEIKRIDTAVRDPIKAGVPTWMINRQNDTETGENMHLLMGTLDYTKQNDIKMLSKTKSYRGLRHQWGLTLRGQRTQSNFRPSKSRLASASKKGRRKKSD